MRRMEVWSPSRTQRYYKTTMALAVLLVLSFTGNVFLWKYRYDEGYSMGSEIAYENDYEVGYDEGYLQARKDFGAGYYIRNPTISEVRKFIKTDKTDSEEYEMGDYVCFDFAATFKRNAFSAGYLCYLVWINMGVGAGHTINAFNTTDGGTVFVEPQTDEVVELKIGEHYWPEDHRGFESDIIKDYGLIP